MCGALRVLSAASAATEGPRRSTARARARTRARAQLRLVLMYRCESVHETETGADIRACFVSGHAATMATARSTPVAPAWPDRKSGVSGKSVEGRVDIGGRRIIKKTKKHTTRKTQIPKI